MFHSAVPNDYDDLIFRSSNERCYLITLWSVKSSVWSSHKKSQDTASFFSFNIMSVVSIPLLGSAIIVQNPFKVNIPSFIHTYSMLVIEKVTYDIFPSSVELLTNFIKCEKFLPWRAAWMRQTHSLVVLSLDCFLYHQEAIPRDNNLFHTHPLRKILFGDIKEPTTKIKNSIKAHDKTCLTLQLFKQENGWKIT